jgi:hypothetical protein
VVVEVVVEGEEPRGMGETVALEVLTVKQSAMFDK